MKEEPKYFHGLGHCFGQSFPALTDSNSLCRGDRFPKPKGSGTGSPGTDKWGLTLRCPHEQGEPARGAGLALPDAIPVLQGGAGATAASASRSTEHERDTGTASSSEFQAASSMAAFGDNSSSTADVGSGAVTHGLK